MSNEEVARDGQLAPKERNYAELCVRAHAYFLDNNNDDARRPPCPENNDSTYEDRFSDLLENWHAASMIDDWVKLPNLSRIDLLKVDFLVALDGNIFPIQVASTSENARLHRQKINRNFPLKIGEKIPIGVISLLRGPTPARRHSVTDSELYLRLLDFTQRVQPIPI